MGATQNLCIIRLVAQQAMPPQAGAPRGGWTGGHRRAEVRSRRHTLLRAPRLPLEDGKRRDEREHEHSVRSRAFVPVAATSVSEHAATRPAIGCAVGADRCRSEPVKHGAHCPDQSMAIERRAPRIELCLAPCRADEPCRARRPSTASNHGHAGCIGSRDPCYVSIQDIQRRRTCRGFRSPMTSS
jgi:hypothetical protein